MFLPDRIVFSDFMLTWKKNIFIYKNVISSENSENHFTAQIAFGRGGHINMTQKLFTGTLRINQPTNQHKHLS